MIDFEKRWNEALESFGNRKTQFGGESRTLSMLQLGRAFQDNVFIYGTVGPNALHNGGGNTGNATARMASKWFTKAKSGRGAVLLSNRNINLYDPGPRTEQLIKMGHQMMDMYYGMENQLYINRNLIIAEFVHYAMYYHKLGQNPAPFDPNISGRDAFRVAFPGVDEGWKTHANMTAIYGHSATKEISKIIRMGIKRFGGKLIFEAKSVFGQGIFDPTGYQGDTDLEAQQLFQEISCNSPQTPYGKGVLEIQWGGKPTLLTRAHFLTNWTYSGKKVTHRKYNQAGGDMGADVWTAFVETAMGSNHGLRPIWNNFAPLPKGFEGLAGMQSAIEEISGLLREVHEPKRVGAYHR